jgi:hypothetical protein
LVWVGAVVALIVVVMAFPAGRRAVANLLDIAGIHVEFGNTPELPLPTDLLPGRRVDLGEAQAAVDFLILQPAVMESPGTVAILDWELGTQVFLGWGESAALPEVGESGIGLLLVEFRADLNVDFFGKLVDGGTTVDQVLVHGAPAFWLGGAPHVFMFETGRRDLVEDETRLTGNVLIWEADGVTFRLESNLNLEESLKIAESLVP